ncbi:MAG: hypothetical protein GY696_23525, partial [Gammaproteobacteria bacterium]|nr:hypothetical protein [Gammaproteobacteria bacterium]
MNHDFRKAYFGFGTAYTGFGEIILKSFGAYKKESLLPIKEFQVAFHTANGHLISLPCCRSSGIHQRSSGEKFLQMGTSLFGVPWYRNPACFV